MNKIKDHKFFKPIDWKRIETGKIKPNPVPLKEPTAENFEDIDYDSDDEDFSHEFTDLEP